ncbi:hypothetical protein D9611_006475 [Ephemerocybe angulata]|uniref:Uncharacterized protein n=1 Tax=Ephemerocybe angulata TaxID=980116 RepID=A0A8H5C7E6_9AGAR|nr:hypothetical protein D9611_006475 [Tulosesus angulatus]
MHDGQDRGLKSWICAPIVQARGLGHPLSRRATKAQTHSAQSHPARTARTRWNAEAILGSTAQAMILGSKVRREINAARAWDARHSPSGLAVKGKVGLAYPSRICDERKSRSRIKQSAKVNGESTAHARAVLTERNEPCATRDGFEVKSVSNSVPIRTTPTTSATTWNTKLGDDGRTMATSRRH